MGDKQEDRVSRSWQSGEERYRTSGRNTPQMEGSPVHESLAIQVGGSHYKELTIQPVEYILANDIPFIEGNVIKYVTRWKQKGGVKDLEKAKHFLEILIEHNSR